MLAYTHTFQNSHLEVNEIIDIEINIYIYIQGGTKRLFLLQPVWWIRG